MNLKLFSGFDGNEDVTLLSMIRIVCNVGVRVWVVGFDAGGRRGEERESNLYFDIGDFNSSR